MEIRMGRLALIPLMVLVAGCGGTADDARREKAAAGAALLPWNGVVAQPAAEIPPAPEASAERPVAGADVGVTAGFGFGPHRAYSRAEGQGVAEYYAVASGDFNGDQRDDVVALTEANTVDLFLQRVDGSLAQPIVYRYGSATYRSQKIMRVDDYNGDHIADVAFHTINAQGVSGGVGLLLSRPGNSPAFRQGYADYIGTNTPQVVDWASLDVDGDHLLDIVVARNEGNGFTTQAPCLTPWCPTYEVLHGDGSGGFGRPRKVYLNLAERIFQLVAESLDDDALRDLVLVVGQTNGQQSTGRVLAARRVGAGGLAALQELHRAPAIHTLSFGDITGDGWRDSVMGDQIQLRLGNGGFDATRMLAMHTGYPITPLLADLDGDGFTDLVNHQLVDFTGTPFLAVYLQRSGTLQLPFRVSDPPMQFAFKVSNGMSPYASGDWNHDGCKDLAVAAGYDGMVVLDGTHCSPKPHPTGGNLPPRLR